METAIHFPVVIIGAGPAGVACARQLEKQGVKYKVIEKGDSVGYSWGNMPDHLDLITLWKDNCILKEDMPMFHRYRRNTAEEFYTYLNDIQQKENLNINFNEKVLDVSKQDELFYTKTSDNLFSSDRLINATGYYASPYWPEYVDQENKELLQLHFKDFTNAKNLKTMFDKERPKILVVGKRLSAGQLIEELHEDFDVALTVRSKIEYGLPPLLESLSLKIYHVVENIGLWLFKPEPNSMNKNTEVVMHYGAYQIIKKHNISVYPDIANIQGKEVEFVDGQKQTFDAVIYATGFRPHLDHLSFVKTLDEKGEPKMKNAFESVDVENLYFIGLDNQIDFRSRFIRGIRNDAITLVNRLDFAG